MTYKKLTTKMKKIFYLFVVCLLTVSCVNTKNNEVSRAVSQFKVLNDEILTSFPGGIYLLNEHIVWFEPFTTGHFLHFLDKNSGIEVISLGNIGQGPKKYISPMVNDIIWNNCLYVSDANGNTKGYFSIDRFDETGDAFIERSKEDSLIRSKGYNMRLEDNLYIGFNRNNEDKAYKLYSNGVEKNFGEYILPDKKYNFGSIILYNPDKELLVTGSLDVNYFSCYIKDDDNFRLIWENREEYKYSENNNRIVFDSSKKGIYEMALTKDFIVALQRDYENDPTDESQVGRDFEKNPQTLFVYDYKGNLLKIINYNVPIGRIAGDQKTNMVYALCVDPDFKLGVSLIE
jgi:hypothetical protein